MSLSKLHSHLIAQIADFLDYSDICNLMETNKRNYLAIKGYKKNKIKLFNIEFKKENGHLVVKATDISKKPYFLKNLDDVKEELDKIKGALSQCAHIEDLFLSFDLTKDLFNVLMKTKSIIRKIVVSSGKMLISVEEMLELYRNFEGVLFFLKQFDVAIFNDEVLTNLILHGTIMRIEDRPIVNMSSPELITDNTLKALVRHRVPHIFSIQNVYNSITVKKIVNSLKVGEKCVQNHGYRLYWNFGILQPDQVFDARRYFSRNGKLRRLFNVTVSQNEAFETYGIKSRVHVEFEVRFSIFNPWF